MAYLPHIDDPSVFCDSTAFSAIDNSSTLLSPPVSEGKSVISKASSPGPVFPILPPAHNFSVLGNPERFQSYISTELPLAYDGVASGSPMPPPPPAPPEKLRRNVNSTFFNSLLKRPDKVIHGTLEWVQIEVFPDFKLPIPFNENAIRLEPKLWNSNALTIPSPPNDMTEAKMRVWLNNIASNLAVVHKIATTPNSRSDRCFDSSTATKGPAGGYMLRKPDISVIDREEQHDSTKTQEERLYWRKVYAFIEVTGTNSGPLSNVLRQISQKAACIFDMQPQRKFACAVGIFGGPTKLEFIFAVVDRAGMTHTQPTEIKSYAVLAFLRIIFAFCYANPDTLGWDPTMKVDPETNEVTSITVTGCERDSTTPTTRTFDIVKLLHKSPILYSRGTRVWIVKDQQGSFYVLKDSWILAANVSSEIEFIKHIGKTIKEEPKGYLFKYTCPTYYIGEDCVCSTDTIRGLLPDKPPTRHQRRIVTATIGDPITSFRSKKEFVATYLDLVNGLEFLNTKANVIHGDISINNILINRVWRHGPVDSPSQLRRLASANANTLPDASDLNDHDDSMSQLESVSNEASVVQPPAISAPVVQGPAPAPAISTIDYGGTFEPIEAAGMIIDCEFMRYTNQDTHRTSGTLPFMAIEALMPTANNQFKHHAGHDLECLLNTMITICHYTVGPGGKLREAVAGDENIKFNEWFSTAGRVNLATTKSITLEAFNTFIQPVLPKYWEDFAPFLRRLVQATWQGMPYIEQPNVATHQAYRDILKEALAKYTLEEKNPPAVYAFVPKAKRPIEDSQPLRRSKRQRRSEAGGPSELGCLPRRSVSHFLESFVESIEEPVREDPSVNE